MNIEQMCRDFIRELKQARLDNDPAALSPRTIADYEEAYTRRIIPAFGSMRPRSFKPTHAAQYLYAAKKAGRAVRANREIAALGSAFNHGMALGVVNDNPCRGVRRNRERPRSRTVGIGEVNAVIELARGKGAAYYMVALIAVTVAITGRRRAEILRLSASQLSEAGITASDSKVGGRHYLIAWSPLLREVLTEAAALRKSPDFAFPTREGVPYTDSGFKCLWARIMRDYEAKNGQRFRPHDLRALYVSAMLDKGQSPETHQNEATMRRVYDRRKLIKVKPLA